MAREKETLRRRQEEKGGGKTVPPAPFALTGTAQSTERGGMLGIGLSETDGAPGGAGEGSICRDGQLR